MNKATSILSRIMLIGGAILILAGLGWSAWRLLNAPPPPTITDEGAVVMAVTAPSLATMTAQQAENPDPAATPNPSPAPGDSSSQGTVTEGFPEISVTEIAPTPDQPASTESVGGGVQDATGSQSVAPTPTPEAPASTPEPAPTPVPPAEKAPQRIVAPAIDLDAKVVPMGWEMIDWEGKMISKWIVPKRQAGWHMNSAMPGHGENVVISGHHNIGSKVFRNVIDLSPGDEITLRADAESYPYTVTEKYILKEAGMPIQVRRANAQWILPTGDERLTLVTCWPYEWPGNTHRVIVVARPPAYFHGNVEASQ